MSVVLYLGPGEMLFFWKAWEKRLVLPMLTLRLSLSVDSML